MKDLLYTIAVFCIFLLLPHTLTAQLLAPDHSYSIPNAEPSHEFSYLHTGKEALDFPMAFRQEVEFIFDQTIEDPILWSLDHPNL